MKILTISAGVSTRDQWVTDVSWQDIVERANDALQQARNQGPNHIVNAQTDKTFVSDAGFFEGIAPHQ
jgi:PleD family two-component response regulator